MSEACATAIKTAEAEIRAILLALDAELVIDPALIILNDC